MTLPITRGAGSSPVTACRGGPAVNADDRILLLDWRTSAPGGCGHAPSGSRMQALINAADAAGPVHHAVAAYAVPPETDDGPLASLLAQLRIAPLRVPPGPDAAEFALLAHARHVHAAGGRIFLVGSADGRFAELATLGRVELLVWDGQPVATRIAEVAHRVQRIARPTAGLVNEAATERPTAPDPDEAPQAPALQPTPHRRRGGELVDRLRTALATGVGTGVGIAVGQRLFDTLLPRRKP